MKAIAELVWSRSRVRPIRTFAAFMLMVAAPLSAEARTISKPIGLWVRSGGQTTVVIYAPPVRQSIIYQSRTVIHQPACRPALPQQRAE